MSTLARPGRTAALVDLADRDLDLAILADWPRFAHAAARAFATLNGSGTPIPAVLAASAVAVAKIPIASAASKSPLPATETFLAVRVDDPAVEARRLDRLIAESLQTAFRASQRSLPGPASAWLDHAERVILDTVSHSPAPLSTSLAHWVLTLARIDATHPVVMIGIAATQRRLAAAARHSLERAVLDGSLDRAAVEPLHRAVSHAITAWNWNHSSLTKQFDPRQPLPTNVSAQLGLLQQPALTIRDALQQRTPATVLTSLATHDFGAATLAAMLVNDPVVDAAVRETRIQTMASGQLRPIATTRPTRAVAAAEQATRRVAIAPQPDVQAVTAPVVDSTQLPILTPELERAYASRRDRGQVAQARITRGLVLAREMPATEAAMADGRAAVAELIVHGGRTINAALGRTRDQFTYAARRDVVQQAWLLATEAATTFDPDKGRWTSYLKDYLEATLRPATRRMDNSGTVLPLVRVRVADPAKAEAQAKLFHQRLRPVVAGDFAQFNERDPDQQPADEQALNRMESERVDRVTDRILRELDALPPLRRDSVNASYFDTEPIRDVAERHQVSTRTVMREAHRGLDDLTTRLVGPGQPATLDRRLQRHAAIEHRQPSTGPRPVTGISR